MYLTKGTAHVPRSNLDDLAETFELARAATEQLLGEYALFVLEDEAVVNFLYEHLETLEQTFERALCYLDQRQAEKTLADIQFLFGEAQIKVNRSVIPYDQISKPALTKTNF